MGWKLHLTIPRETRRDACLANKAWMPCSKLRNKGFAWALLLLATGLIATPGEAQNHSLSGYVRDDATQQPIQGISIELKDLSGQIAAPAAISGTNGAFAFYRLAEGYFYIVVQARDYEPLQMQVSLESSSKSNISVMLTRIRKSEKADAFPISTRELTIPGKAKAFFEKGVSLIHKKQDYKGALEEFQRAVGQYPEYYEAYDRIGVSEYHLGDFPAAEKALRKSAELSKNQYCDASFLLAAMLNDLNRFVDAEPVSRTGVACSETSWQGHYELARALAGQKKSDDAELSAIKARDLNSGNPQIFLVLGNIHMQKREYAAVVEDFGTYLKLDPQGPLSDQVRKKRQQLQNALEKQPTSPQSATEPRKP
jgi:tetratricopeptide (TPR) repeat protein